MILPREFYSQSVLTLAPLLLGKRLCRRVNGEVISLRVTETEAYAGEEDTACHAYRGRTPRNGVMYGPAGFAYIYLCYGIHSLLNVVAAETGRPEAVLIRGLEGLSGPGRLTKVLGIHYSMSGTDLTASDKLWLEDGAPFDYETAPRIGIGYASEEDKARMWRYIAKI